MGRGGTRPDRTGPERRCLITGETGPRTGLVRFVIGPDGEVVPDLLAKLPGRGMWVTSDRELLGKAATGKAFTRAARQAVKVPDDLVDGIERGLAAQVIGLVALARKAGQAVAGYEKVKGWLEGGAAAVLLQASDGSERGKARLRPPAGPDSLIDILTGAELGSAFGREKVIHGALAGGGLASRVVEEASRLAGLRPLDGGTTAPGKE